MIEIKNLAQTMRESIAALKAKVADVTTAFQTEVTNSNVNVEKVTSLTKELKAANQEMEQMLGQSGSNFTPTGSADLNGVTKNG